MIEEPPKLTVRRPDRRPTDDDIAAFQGVPTGFVVDAMDGRGALAPDIRPLGDGTDLPGSVAGPALTAGSGPGDILAMLAALAFVGPGDVLVATVAGHRGCAAAGDRLMGMLKNAGGAALVTDGPMRDRAGVVAVGLPAWCTGLHPGSPFTTGPGRIGLPIQIGGQRVETGDMVVADRDGVVIVPFDEIASVRAALDRVRAAEAALDAEVAGGLSVPDPIRALLAGPETRYLD